jgi:septal ring factor EnvC (AmiA/AmiB activator)
LISDKTNLTGALDKANRELQEALREIEMLRFALAPKVDLEKELHKSILKAHEVRGELAKSRATVAEDQDEIKRLSAELDVVKKLQSDIADLKERFRVVHRRLIESEEEIMRLRPFEKSTPLLEKKIQNKVTELS